MKLINIIVLTGILILFIACTLDEPTTPMVTPLAVPTIVPLPDSAPATIISDTDTGANYEVFNIDTGGEEYFNYSLELSGSRDVYFMLTNSLLQNVNLPQLVDPNKSIQSKSTTASSASSLSSRLSETSISKSTSVIDTKPIGIKGSPQVTEWNEYLRDKPDFLTLNNKSSRAITYSEPQFDMVGEPNQKLYDAENNYINATCRSITSAPTAFGTKTLNIWVANDCWETTGNKTFNVTQDMIDALAVKFLNHNTSSQTDDIYDWVTNLYGEEWSDYTSKYNNVIPESDEITIFLYDIFGDNSTNGGYLGMFFSRDNLTKGSIGGASNYSNERIMFYLDAVLLATPDNINTGWNASDYWPQEIVSTLAHEFQHMINFHIKTISKDGISCETWLNEMMAQCTEDIIADKMGVNGPRGVSYLDPTDGNINNKTGRPPLHNIFNDMPLAYWPTSINTAYDELELYGAYSNKYVFGAYLMRNYNPASFLNSLMNNNYLDYLAVEDAVPGSDSIGQILADSGIANIISDIYTSSPSDQAYIFNTNSWVSETLNGISYSLGSINLYNYLVQINDTENDIYINYTGPYFYTSSPIGQETYYLMPPLTNFYYKVGENLAGNISRNIYMQSGTLLSVIVK